MIEMLADYLLAFSGMALVVVLALIAIDKGYL